ncbi:MBL fold metallo-hydrolase [Amphritea sp.]|uniref:MBL fold metallo-hydrolase n=1 Tax=Amphritea sp. TaxID=1872502 RepID=UPI003D0F9D7A
MAIKIAEKWFERKKINDRLTLLWEPHVNPLIRCNIWHIRGRDADLLVDSGMGICSLKQAASDLFERSITAVATHTHHDHVGSLHEFSVRVVHRLEAPSMCSGAHKLSLLTADYPDDMKKALADVGCPLPEHSLLSAYPEKGFNPANVTLQGIEPTRLVDEGDRIDLGDLNFEILHLPGHSPGSIALWEEKMGWFFSGDAIYDGPLLDNISGACVEDYLVTMERLLKLPVQSVYPGHDEIFGRSRHIEIARHYIQSKSL